MCNILVKPTYILCNFSISFCPYIPGVRSCYDEGKRVAETLMFDYHRQHGIGKAPSSHNVHENYLCCAIATSICC